VRLITDHYKTSSRAGSSPAPVATTNIEHMKAKLFFLFILLVSCQNKYLYTEIIERDSLIKSKEIFSATNDTSAYLIAYEKFCVSLVAYDAVKSKMGFVYDPPVDFELYNKDGVELTKTISFKTKTSKEEDIYNRVFKIHQSIQEKMETDNQ
jgi:hypothetical protein